MKIVRFQAENIKKLRVVEITPAGNIVEVTGPNGSGKSSVLDSIFYALGGSREIPNQPIRKGALKAHVTLDLGEIAVTRKFTQGGGGSLIVEAKDGYRFTSPQKMLDELLGKLTFDPLAFTRMDAKAQLEQLRGMMHLDIDIDQIDRENAADFEKRTELSRQIKSLEAQASAITFDDDTPADAIDESELLNEMQNAAAANAEIESEKGRRDREVTQISDGIRQAERLRIEAHAALKKAEELEAQAQEIEKHSDERRAALNGLQPIADPIDTAELREMITGARYVNDHVVRRKQREKLLEMIASAKAGQSTLTRAMDHRLEQKQEAIANAKMPIAGLSFGEGEVLYRGLPFNQASNSEQLRISTAIAFAANPKLRVVRIQDGSLLDEGGMQMLAEMADKADMQVWIERVDTSGRVGIVMEDGEVKTVNEPRGTA